RPGHSLSALQRRPLPGRVSFAQHRWDDFFRPGLGEQDGDHADVRQVRLDPVVRSGPGATMRRPVQSALTRRFWFGIVLALGVLSGFLAARTGKRPDERSLSEGSALEHYQRGLDLFGDEENDQAIAEFTEAIRLRPTYAQAYHYRGWAYEKIKEYTQAIAD